MNRMSEWDSEVKWALPLSGLTNRRPRQPAIAVEGWSTEVKNGGNKDLNL